MNFSSIDNVVFVKLNIFSKQLCTSFSDIYYFTYKKKIMGRHRSRSQYNIWPSLYFYLSDFRKMEFIKH
jgi:hypothetical protein